MLRRCRHLGNRASIRVEETRDQGRRGAGSVSKSDAEGSTPSPGALAKKPRRPRATPAIKAERARLFEDRVEYVAGIMRRLEFRQGVTGEALAEEFDLPRNAYLEIQKEAMRRVRAELADDHDRILGKVGAALDRVIDRAILSGDNHAVIKAAQVWATVSGAAAVTRVEVSQDLSAMTPEQIAARKAEILARLGIKPLPETIDVPALPAGE